MQLSGKRGIGTCVVTIVVCVRLWFWEIWKGGCNHTISGYAAAFPFSFPSLSADKNAITMHTSSWIWACGRGWGAASAAAQPKREEEEEGAA